MIKINFDGGCQPNPGGTASIGVVIEKDGVLIKKISAVLGEGEGMSNNVAEYVAAKKALEFLIENNLNDEPIAMCGDSQLVIQQMKGAWEIKKGMYVEIAHRTKALSGHFKQLSWSWIPSEQNVLADILS